MDLSAGRAAVKRIVSAVSNPNPSDPRTTTGTWDRQILTSPNIRRIRRSVAHQGVRHQFSGVTAPIPAYRFWKHLAPLRSWEQCGNRLFPASTEAFGSGWRVSGPMPACRSGSLPGYLMFPTAGLQKLSRASAGSIWSSLVGSLTPAADLPPLWRQSFCMNGGTSTAKSGGESRDHEQSFQGSG